MHREDDFTSFVRSRVGVCSTQGKDMEKIVIKVGWAVLGEDFGKGAATKKEAD